MPEHPDYVTDFGAFAKKCFSDSMFKNNLVSFNEPFDLAGALNRMDEELVGPHAPYIITTPSMYLWYKRLLALRAIRSAKDTVGHVGCTSGGRNEHRSHQRPRRPPPVHREHHRGRVRARVRDGHPRAAGRGAHHPPRGVAQVYGWLRRGVAGEHRHPDHRDAAVGLVNLRPIS